MVKVNKTPLNEQPFSPKLSDLVQEVVGTMNDSAPAKKMLHPSVINGYVCRALNTANAVQDTQTTAPFRSQFHIVGAFDPQTRQIESHVVVENQRRLSPKVSWIPGAHTLAALLGKHGGLEKTRQPLRRDVFESQIAPHLFNTYEALATEESYRDLSLIERAFLKFAPKSPQVLKSRKNK